MTQKPRPTIALAATCACGAVEVRVSGTVRSMLLCSCEDCQKASGTGHSAIAIVDKNDVTLAGETRGFEREAASGAMFTQRFCPVCGTPVCGETSRRQDALLLPVGLFGRDTEWFAPTQLIFSRSHRDWDMIDPDLPQHETYRQPGVEH